MFCLAKHGFFMPAISTLISSFPSGYQFNSETHEGKTMSTKARPEDIERCASIWFLRLETAREHGRKDAEREARQKLKDLGVDVRFKRETSR